MTIGERIHHLRKREHLTMEELAEKIGVQKSAIHKYESGIVDNIPLKRLRLLAEALNTTPEYLLIGDKAAKAADVGISLEELSRMTESKNEPTQPTTPTEPTEPTKPTTSEQKEQEDMELYIVGSVLTMTAAICGTLYIDAKRKEKLIREHRVYREDAYCKVEKRAQAWEELYHMEHDENIRLKAMLKVCKMIIAQSDFRKGSNTNKKTEE